MSAPSKLLCALWSHKEKARKKLKELHSKEEKNNKKINFNKALYRSLEDAFEKESNILFKNQQHGKK